MKGPINDYLICLLTDNEIWTTSRRTLGLRVWVTIQSAQGSIRLGGRLSYRIPYRPSWKASESKKYSHLYLDVIKEKVEEVRED